jgi:hypothetical protein
LKNKDKIKECGKTATNLRTSKLKVLCISLTANLISELKHT